MIVNSRLHIDARWLLIGLLWFIFVAVAVLIYSRHPNGAGDYSYYYRGIQRILTNTPLYDNLQANDYVGPPLQIQLMTPFVALTSDYKSSTLAWFAFNVLLLLSTLALLSRHIPRHRDRLILWLVPPLFVPTLMSLWLGQITVVLFALTTGAWVAYKEDKPELTGILLALAVWTKFYPGLFLVYFLWKRDWRVVISAAVTTLAAIILQMVISGADSFVYYLINILPKLTAEGQPALNHSNNAILGFAQKMFSESPQIYPLLLSPLLVTLTRFGLLIGLIGVTLYFISRPTPDMAHTTPQKFDLEYASVLLVALLSGSTLGLHGMLSMLLVYVILLRNRHSLPHSMQFQLKFGCLLASILINLHLPIILGTLQPPSENTAPALLLSLPFFGMIIIWAIVVTLLYRHTRQNRPAEIATTAV